MMSGGSFLGDMLQTITERGRNLLPFNMRGDGAAGRRSIASMCDTLLSSSGEASGMALAKDILERWRHLDEAGRLEFMETLLQRFGPDTEALETAIDIYRQERSPQALLALHGAAEPRRQELIRRLNLAPNGIATLVAMREFLLRQKRTKPDLEAVDADFAHLFGSWFNRGFLVLRPISWATPADILEKIIRYEAVHEIGSWDELRRRLAPEDRRCFAFFHPQLADEPLIFVEVALTRTIPGTIGELLDEGRTPIAAGEATTAVFYSISNCQEGLRGISFGNFLIKQVVEDLRRDLPRLDTFVTLSPVPGFARWLADIREDDSSTALTQQERAALAAIDTPGWSEDADTREAVRPAMMQAAAHYFLNARTRHGKPIDPVARFHLGNGARLERINYLADRAPRAMRQAHGLMVNYLYKREDIEANHEAFAARGEVVAAPPIRRMARPAATPAKPPAPAQAAADNHKKTELQETTR
jgi:malonyl-CoA decarboxylase